MVKFTSNCEMSLLMSKTKNGNGFEGSATTFDESVNQLLNSLYVYINKLIQAW